MKLIDTKQIYPELLSQLPYFECGEGWASLLMELFSVLERERCRIVQLGTEDELPTVVQCKEKFGTLRCYMHNETPEMSGAIALAEIISARTCEVCGRKGKLRQGGWLKTLCLTHHRERKAKMAAT